MESLRANTEPEILARSWMDRHLKVHVLKVYRNHPIPGVQGLEDRLRGLHTKARQSDKAVEAREIYNRPPIARDLQSDKQTAVKARLQGR